MALSAFHDVISRPRGRHLQRIGDLLLLLLRQAFEVVASNLADELRGRLFGHRKKEVDL